MQNLLTSAARRYGSRERDVPPGPMLRAAGVKLYRTDFQGEITLTSRGSDDFKITTAKEAKPEQDVWAGREALRDDSARRGFIDFGDLPPAPTPKPEKPKAATKTGR